MGGRAAVAALSPEMRAAYRELARKLYDAGSTAGKAERFIQKRTEGFVYILTHPAWPGYVKIGRACDPEQRLASYQTGCPMRAYRMFEAVYFGNCQFAEAELHARLHNARVHGEWFALSAEYVLDQINQLREIL